MAEETSTNEWTVKNSKFFPLTPNQEVIWVETKLYPGTPIYCVGGYLLIEGEVLPRELKQAVNAVIDKNDALRIKIHEIDGKPYQKITEVLVTACDTNTPDTTDGTAAGKEGQGAKSLCCYFTAGETLHAADLREFLSQDLPAYMIPTYFLQVKSFPLTSAGKIDKKALPAPGGAIGDSGQYEAPRSEVERKLVEAWQQVLGSRKVGIRDSFFQMGGDSIKAIQVVSWRLLANTAGRFLCNL